MAYYTTQKDKLKYLRKVCRDEGLIFKRNNNFWLNDKAVYMIEDRETGEIISNFLSIESAYDSEINNSFISKGYNDNDVDYL